MTTPSIRSRLARTLLAWSIFWSLAVSAAVGLAVRHEVGELLDDTLQETAQMWVLIAGPLLNNQLANSTHAAPPLSNSGRFAWQWVSYQPLSAPQTASPTAQVPPQLPQVILASSHAPPNAFQAVPRLGLSDTPHWRVFGTALPQTGQVLYIAQTLKERDEAQWEAVLSAALVTLAIALLAHIWLRARVSYELQPLQALAQRLSHYDPLQTKAKLGDAERAELIPVYLAIDGLAQRLLQRVVHERAFSAHTAHALRTPLAGIDVQLSVALRECPPELVPRLQRLRTAAARLQRVVTALLAFFRSGLEIKRVPLDLIELSTRWPVEGLRLQIHQTHPVSADADLLSAALLNLFDNALRYGATECTLTTPSPNVISISDNGTGVSAERLQTLQQAIDQQAYENNTGLGLMLVDQVVRAHGGQVRFLDALPGFHVEMNFGDDNHRPQGTAKGQNHASFLTGGDHDV